MSLAFGLAAPDAWAGSYTVTYSGGTYTIPGPTGQPTPFPDALGTTQNLASGYGGDSGGQTASCTGPISVSWKWSPDKNKTMTTDPPPPSVVVEQSSSVKVTVVSPTANGSYDTGMGNRGQVVWSPGGNNTRSATNFHYSVQVGGATITLGPITPAANASAPGDTASVRYTAVIINGNWAGPYYFHHGNYVAHNSSLSGGWKNNTAGGDPSIEDIPDGIHKFELSGTSSGGYAEVTGSITPVWYWTGPNLGGPPPSFEITVVTTAVAQDNSDNTPVQLHADDGQGSTPRSSPPGSLSSPAKVIEHFAFG